MIGGPSGRDGRFGDPAHKSEPQADQHHEAKADPDPIDERIDDQLLAVDPLAPLYASTAFIYRDNMVTRYMLMTWWTHTSLYHSVDQLSLPHAIAVSGAKVNVIPDNYLKCEALEYVRNKK